MTVLLTDLSARAHDIGARVAGPASDDVDRQARFPSETVAELRRSGLLGALLPIEWGGEGATLAAVALAVSALAEYCASSALILAMHSIQATTIVRHARPSCLESVAPALSRGELLLASANSEVGLAGERRTSICALEPVTQGYHLEKAASTVSYGEYADAILATARRTPESAANDQVLAICMAEHLSLISGEPWDALGLRGTCSQAGHLQASIAEDMVIEDYAAAFVKTGLPASAILLGAVWLGLAEAGAARAHGSVREQARRCRRSTPGSGPPASGLRLAELSVILHQLREVHAGAVRRWEQHGDTPEVTSLAFSTQMDQVKLSTSTLVNDVMGRAMAICGMAGYANTSPFSIARLSRDAAAAPLMVNNDRALTAMAQTLLVRKTL